MLLLIIVDPTKPGISSTIPGSIEMCDDPNDNYDVNTNKAVCQYDVHVANCEVPDPSTTVASTNYLSGETFEIPFTVDTTSTALDDIFVKVYKVGTVDHIHTENIKDAVFAANGVYTYTVDVNDFSIAAADGDQYNVIIHFKNAECEKTLQIQLVNDVCSVYNDISCRLGSSLDMEATTLDLPLTIDETDLNDVLLSIVYKGGAADNDFVEIQDQSILSALQNNGGGSYTYQLDGASFNFLSEYTVTISSTHNGGSCSSELSVDVTHKVSNCPSGYENLGACTGNSCVVESSASDFCRKTKQITIPLDTYILDFSIQGHKSSNDNTGYVFTGKIPVQPLDEVALFTGTYGEAAYIKINNNIVAVAAGASTSGNGGTMYDNTNSGEGVISSSDLDLTSSNGYSYAQGNVFYMNENSVYSTSTYAHVSVSFEQSCPTGYTELHSDFDPILLPDSTLYIEDNVSKLKLNVKLPYYYYDEVFTYGDQCSEQPSVTSELHGCWKHHLTEIAHSDHCSFEVIDNNDKYEYRGVITIAAKLLLDVNGYSLHVLYKHH